MAQDYRNTREKLPERVRALVSLIMGCMYILVPVFALRMPWLRAQYNKSTLYTLAVLFGLYGLFRIFRGVQTYRRTQSP